MVLVFIEFRPIVECGIILLLFRTKKLVSLLTKHSILFKLVENLKMSTTVKNIYFMK